MKNIERQKSLDKKKWLESEKKGEDMSGAMDYCKECNRQHYYLEECQATQEERETACLCATAYNRMQRTRK